jgi:RHS repeat-associated protein
LGRFDQLTRYKDIDGGAAHHVADSLWEFDEAGRLTGLTHQDDSGTPTVFADYDFLYDVAGRIAAFDFDSLSGSSGDADYAHDATGQLTDADYAADWQCDEDYDYDALGNRTNAGYTVGANNQLTSDGTYAYTYDEEGNRLARFVDNDSSGTLNTGDTNITEYEWDHRNRLTKVTTRATYGGAATKIVEYAYDFGNRWVRKVLNSDGNGTANASTIFVHDDNQIALQFDDVGSGNLTDDDLSHRYLRGPTVDQLLTDEQVTSLGSAGPVYWPLTDHLNTIRDAIDNTATVQLHRVYDAFGNFTENPSNINLLFAFTGRPFDEDTSLQNNLNRWYDAAVGRWLSEDPVGFVAGDVNLTRYCRNGGTNANDPTGLTDVKVASNQQFPTSPDPTLNNVFHAQ